MRYKTPNEVKSPRDAISNVDVLFDGGIDSVSVARLTWFGKQVLGMRWNIALREWDDLDKESESKECLGMPVSRGYSTWFVLPDEMFDENSPLSDLLRRLSLNTID